MDALIDLMWPTNAWHWLGIGLILLAIEMAVGTFDLLWIAIAAAATSVFAAIAPGSISGWEGQLVLFAVASIGLLVFGRTVFADIRMNAAEHPTLNKRMSRAVGKTGTAMSDFVAGAGRVRLGDTDWSAETVDGSNPVAGANVVVEATAGNALRVRAA
ncbi:NfeD family protein [Henriciella litoralis]|uniref:NfeD family protein n=1 Tax=Henriciella litoralis TaxID=568102 RepID=UPI0009FD8EA0|nr:NfeD family protein [Henriciella litoralis]